MQKVRQGDQLETSFYLKKSAQYEVKGSGLQLSFNISIALNLQYNKNKLYKTLNY